MFSNVYSKDKLYLYLLLPIEVIRHFGNLYRYINQIRIAATNWYIAPLIYLGIKKQGKILLKDGTRFILSKATFEEFIGVAQSFANNTTDKKIKIKSKEYVELSILNTKLYVSKSSVNAIKGEFYSNSHKVIGKANIKNRVILDVGAYMGETALLYVIWGKAKRVYSFEPVERLYATMVKNIRLNNLENKITPVRALLVGKTGAYNARNSFEISKERINEISLSEFVIKNDIKDAILKLDCEGGEYEIINDTPASILRRFKILHIEYHYGYKDLIIKLKEAGFKVTYTKPALSIVGMFSSVKYMGDIIAVREGAGNIIKRYTSKR